MSADNVGDFVGFVSGRRVVIYFVMIPWVEGLAEIADKETLCFPEDIVMVVIFKKL